MDYFTALIVRLFVFISGLVPFLAQMGLGKFQRWEQGKPLKILFVGYNGARNTGADVRVAVMVKQLQSVLGKDNIQISILTQNVENFKVYFGPEIHLIKFNTIFFGDLLAACNQHHMAVLCEGSTLKSKFSNVLTLFFCQTAGIMKKQKKPCIAYGSEAGEMDGYIRSVVKDMCDQTYFIARTEDSLQVIDRLGLKGHLGTDTAWMFDSSSKKDWAYEELIRSGWDGKKPLLGLALINPFWWPVKPSLFKLFMYYFLNHREFHYNKWYFFSWSSKRQQAFELYISSIANAVKRFAEKVDYYPVLIGMEALDLKACRKFQEILGKPSFICASVDYDGYEMKEILSKLSILITSRYHARVLSLEARIPAIAISMDERLENIYKEIGHFDQYYFTVDEKSLESKLYKTLVHIETDRNAIMKDLDSARKYYEKKLNDMGSFFYDFVKDQFKEIPI